MDFSQTSSEQDFISKVKGVLDEKIRPKRREWYQKNTTPKSMFQVLGESQLLGFTKDEEGIFPIPWQHNIHYYKEMAQISGGVAIASFAHSQLGLQAFYYFGDEDHKSKYLVPGLQGQRILAFANTEFGAGSDAAAISLKAQKEGDKYVLSGSKAFITNGDIADHIVLTAVTHPEKEKKHQRISMFVVDGNSPGLKRTRLEKYGWAPSHLCTLEFDSVEIPEKNLVGEPGRGFYQTMAIFNSSRIGIAALSFGTALGAYKLAYHHAQKRNVFGSSLLEHQSKKNEFADYMTRLEATWLLVNKAAYLKDQGKEFRFNASIAKLFATEEGIKIAAWACETFGARGVVSSNKVCEFPQDARAALIGEGAPEVQKKIVAEHISEILDSLS
jgi:alkylation response protein AidB-like acyl-CoA dehydrogenase